MTSVHNDETPGRTPVPDPTVLTTQALLREIAALKELVTTRFAAMDEAVRLSVINTNLEIECLKDTRGVQFEVIDQKLAVLKEMFTTVDTKFAAVDEQFRQRDIRASELATQAEKAIAAALSAAEKAVGEQNKSNKEAIDKTEANITKQIDGIKTNFETALVGVNGAVSDLKDRMTRIESLGVGASGQRAESHNATALVVSASLGVLGLVVGFGGIAIAIASK